MYMFVVEDFLKKLLDRDLRTHLGVARPPGQASGLSKDHTAAEPMLSTRQC